MTPDAWRQSAQIKAIEDFKGSAKYWGPIAEKTKRYGTLRADQLAERKRLLADLAGSIAFWKAHQATAWTLDKQTSENKAAALDSVSIWIESERAEIRLATSQVSASPASNSSSIPLSGNSFGQAVSSPIGIPTSRATAPIAIPTTRTEVPMSRPLNVNTQLFPPPTTNAAPWPRTSATVGIPPPRPAVPIGRPSGGIPIPRGGNSVSSASSSYGSLPVTSNSPPSHIGSWEKRRSISKVAVDESRISLFNSVFKVTVHFTKTDHLESISRNGLRPGAAEGIGMPETGERDTNNIYVLSGSNPEGTRAVIGEAGGQAVVVISTSSPTSRDPNYRANLKGQSGAYYYTTQQAPPVRSAPGLESNVFSFLWPPSPTSLRSLTGIVNQRFVSSSVSFGEGEVESILYGILSNRFPLFFRTFGNPSSGSDSGSLGK